MIRAIPAGILRQILLVIVGAEAFSCTEITWLSLRGQSTGRVSVDVAVDPPVGPRYRIRIDTTIRTKAVL
jgi:hypothetical protein